MLLLLQLLGAAWAVRESSVTEASVAYGAPFSPPTLVQLFGWRYSDVAAECGDFLSSHGYGAVQVSPVQEHQLRPAEWTNRSADWADAYSAVGYRLGSDYGSRADFVAMLGQCNQAGVRSRLLSTSSSPSLMSKRMQSHCGRHSQQHGDGGIEAGTEWSLIDVRR